MECPFEKPIKERLEAQYAEGYYKKIEDRTGNAVILVVDFEKADYIVQAINAYESMKEFIENTDNAESYKEWYNCNKESEKKE